MNKDTLVVTLSDMHSGSNFALFPNRVIEFPESKGVHYQRGKQIQIWEHFEMCANRIAEARRGKRLLLVHNGDAIEGAHHNTAQIASILPKEQKDVHIELMVYFKKAVAFQRGDQLYYTLGTETHTGEIEDEIGEQLGAIETSDGVHAFNDIELTVNNNRLWWTHHGPSSGRGANKGNTLRNWLRDQFYERVNEGKLPPHVIHTGHTHDPYWQIYIGRYEGSYFTVRGFISPSWQLKTRYGHKKAPLMLNKIGVQFYTVYANGDIGDPTELIMR